MNLLIVCIFFFVTISLTQVPLICSKDVDCNHLQTGNTKYCSVEDGTCNERGLRFWSDTVGATTRCEGSLRFGNRCGVYATQGCLIPQQNSSHTLCLGSKLDNDRTCQVEKQNFIYSHLNLRCSPNSNPVPEICPSNLQCIQRICRKKLLIGENCRSGIACTPGTVCEGDVCVLEYSLNDGDACYSDSACKSGKCIGNKCLNHHAVPCYSNAECSGLDNFICDRRNNERGFCVNQGLDFYADFSHCLYSRCNSQFDINPAECAGNCSMSYVKQLCGYYCPLRPDDRHSPELKDYTFDCKSLSMKKLGPLQCTVSRIFENCSFGSIPTISLLLLFVSYLINF